MSDMEMSLAGPADTSGSGSGWKSVLRELNQEESLLSADGWRTWRKQWKKAALPPLVEVCQGRKSTPLLWGLPESMLHGDLADLTHELERVSLGKGKSSRRAGESLANWIDEAAEREPNIAFAVECLAWCHAARPLAEHVEIQVWLELLAVLLEVNEQAAGIPLEQAPLVHQLLAGELPIALAYNFSAMEPLRRRAAQARKVAAAGILESLDGEGMPAAEHLSLLRPLVACWCRCGTMCQALAEPLLCDEAGDGFNWAVLQMLRLTGGHGGQLLDTEHSRMPKEFVRFAVGLTDDSQCRAAAALAGYLGKKQQRQQDQHEAPAASAESEWAAVGILRADWSPGSAMLLTVHRDSHVVAELNLAEQVVFSGNVDPRVEVDGRDLALEGEWEQTCWQSDDDVDYLEIEIELQRGWRVQRQIMLARVDGLLLMADALLSPAGDTQPHDLAYHCQWPLASRWQYRSSEETAEGFLLDESNSPRALLLPLALPEWRSGPPRGKLSADHSARLMLSQRARGSRLFAPLLIDFYPRRMRKQITWRQLTVAEQLSIQPADVAVGYRVQLGLEQWLIYRSLAPSGNRTLLGHNLTSEFLVARLDDGEVEPLIEIE